MNVFMGYNPTVAKQVKVSVWVKEIDGAEPILPAAPKDGDCFIVFDTDDDVLADNPSLKKSYANGSWEDAGGGGGSGAVIPEVTVDWSDESMSLGTYTSTVPFDEMYTMVSNYVNARFPLVFPMGEAAKYMTLATAESVDDYRLLNVTIYNSSFQLLEDGRIMEGHK